MIHDVDETLRELVNREILNGSGSKVDISFEAPTSEWASKRQGPVLNLYLYDIREDMHRRRVQFEEIRNEQGRVIDRKMPPRKFRLSYLLTAWTARPEDEHRLLSAALACFTSFDAFPEEVLQGALSDLGEHLRVTVSLPPGDDRGLSDVWLGLGGEMKPSLDIVVTTPIPAQTARELWIGPEVTEEPRISVAVPDGEAEVASGRTRGKRDEDSGEAEHGEAETPAASEIEEAFQGGRRGTEEGRRFMIRTLPRSGRD